MPDMASLWPFVFILLAGWLVTDMWRWLGVLVGNRLSEGSTLLILVRSVATALVAAVIAQLTIYPSGVLAETPVALRLSAFVAGFLAYLAMGKRMLVGIITAEIILVSGLLFLHQGVS